MNIVLYTTHCPKCCILKNKLDGKGIQYEECEDIDAMEKLGIDTVPILKVNDKLLSFPEAVKWVNNKETI